MRGSFHMSNFRQRFNNNNNFNSIQNRMRDIPEETEYTIEDLRNNAIKEDSLTFKKKNKTMTEPISDNALELSKTTILKEYELPEKKKNFKLNREIRIPSFRKIKAGLLTLACFYLIFLIFGVRVTQYTYDSRGYTVPIKMSLDNVKKEKEFEQILIYYMECKTLYEKVLQIDYQLSLDSSQSLILATKYEGILDEIDSFLTQINSLSVKSDYTLLKAMLYNWCSDDVAVYLQNIANALTTNNSTTAEYALTNRAQTKVDFQTITDNFVSVGKTIKGVNVADFQDWTPDYYYNSLSDKN